MDKKGTLNIRALGLLFVSLSMFGFFGVKPVLANTVTVGQTASKASATYFYYAPGATNAYVVINNAIAAAATGATASNPGVVNIENGSKPYETSSHIMAKSNVNIIGESRGGVILKIAKGVSITAYGGPGTTGWGGVDSAAGDGAIINVWTGITNVQIKNITLDGSCGDYYACSNDDRGRHRLVLMNLYSASNIVVDNVKFTNGQDNAIWGNSSNTVEIKNSRFDMVGHDFVEGYKIQNLKFHNNIGAMRTNSGVRCSGTGTNCYVYDNEFYTGSGGASALELQDTFTNVKVYNNYFHDISPYGAIGYGGQSPSGSGHEYYNNLFVNLPYAVSSNVPSSSISRNNIMISCSTTVGKGADTNNIKTESGYTFEKHGTNKSGDTYWVVKSGPLASAFAGLKIGIADGVAGGSDGTVVDPGTNTCTSWTYSDWSTCTNGQQTRTITSSSPAGCAGGNPVLSQTCGSSVDNGFPYPRGTAVPYGYMGCESGNTCISDGATLIHFGWTTSITPTAFAANIKKAKDLGVSKNLIATGGPEMSTESFWKSVKDLGVTDNDFFGVYLPDEPSNASTITAMHTYMKKYFPNAVTGDYLGDMSSGGGTAFIPGLDTVYFTTYTKYHTRPHAWVYGNLIANSPDWKNAGRTIYSATETFGAACTVTSSDADLSTAQKVSDRQVSQIVMGILGGAQGVFSYANKYAKGTPCDTGWTSFLPKYKQVWPWIMKGDRKLLTTTVTSGVKSITSSPGGTISAVTSYLFTDASGNKLVASSDMLDFTEASSTANAATITGVPNGTYDVLWENRTVTVSDGTINDTWQPYGYHFYQLKSSGSSTTAALTATIVPNTVTSVAKGTTNVQLISVKLTNTGTEDLNISGIEIPGSYAPINEANTTLYIDGTKIGTPTTRIDTRVTFAGLNINIAKGASITLVLKGDILTTNIRTTMTFYIEDTTIVTAKGVTSSAAPKITIGGSSAVLTLTSGSVNPTGNSLTATIVPNTITEVEKGATNVQLIAVNLANTGTEDINVAGVEIPGSYAPINEANTALYLGDTKLGTPTTTIDTRVTFTGLNISIPKGGSVTLILKGDILTTNIRTTMTFYIEDTTIVTAKGATSATAPKVTIGGSSSVLTIKTASSSSAALSVTLVPNTVTQVDKGTLGVQLISYKVANTGNENLLISSLGYSGDFKSDSIGNISLFINDKNVGAADSVKDTQLLFSTLQFVLAKGESFTFTLKGDVLTTATAGGKAFIMDKTAGILTAKGMTSGKDAAVTLSAENSSIMIKDSNGIVDGGIVRAYGDIDVYIVKFINGKSFKRLILSPSVFRSYGHLKWEDIVVLDKNIVDSYTTSNLVRLTGDTRVWRLEPSGDTGKKTLVTDTNYDPDSVYEINQADFDSYKS